MNQVNIFDVLGETPEIGKLYQMAIRHDLGYQIAFGTVKEVRDHLVCCDLDTNYHGKYKWQYGQVMTVEEFNVYISAFNQLMREVGL